MENVLYVGQSSEESDGTVEDFGTPVTFVFRQYFIFVPDVVSGKMVSWLVSDPDEEEPVFNKDMMLAFEFKDQAHAIRARDAVRLAGYNCHLFGDLEEA